ncbi:MAG: DinB family protein [Saprospiraceae bacterium]
MIPTRQQQQLDQLGESLVALFSQLEAYSEEQLNRQPDPAIWSPLMVVKHMMLAEGYAQAYVKKKLSYDPKIGKAGLMAALRSIVLTVYFRSPLKWDAPKAIGDDALAGTYELKDLQEEWLQQRKELEQLLTELPPHRYEEEVYKHPFAGRLSIKGMLHFYQGHFERHRRQILARL